MKRKRHIGKLFEVSLSKEKVLALCVSHDEKLGYLMAFLPRDTKVDDDPTHIKPFFYGFIWLDSEIRAKKVKKIRMIDGFEPFTPPLRTQNLPNIDFSFAGYTVRDGGAWFNVDLDYKGLAEMSDRTLYPLESIDWRYANNDCNVTRFKRAVKGQ